MIIVSGKFRMRLTKAKNGTLARFFLIARRSAARDRTSIHHMSRNLAAHAIDRCIKVVQLPTHEQAAETNAI
jgi:hypothetical protein